MTTTPHPTQPIAKDASGVFRFKANAIVQYILDHSNIDLNQIAMHPEFSKEDRQQLAQLIGYSVSGYGELSYVDEAAWDRVIAELENPS